MVLDSKIIQIAQHFNVQDLSDWEQIPPGEILALDGIGPITLDHVRIYLAARGMTLLDDMTPAYWQKHSAAAKIGTQLSEGDWSITAPYTILVDTAEQRPWTFQGFYADSDLDGRPLIIPIKRQHLGPTHGDYTVAGYDGIYIERKSQDDACGTILGWGDRREQFEATLEFLSGIEFGAVVVECSLGDLVSYAPARGKKSRKENAKILHRQVLAWQQDYSCKWIFCPNRRFAEGTAYRLLDRFVRKRSKLPKEPVKRKVDEVLAELF